MKFADCVGATAELRLNRYSAKPDKAQDRINPHAAHQLFQCQS
jgi:hypothetical protein